MKKEGLLFFSSLRMGLRITTVVYTPFHLAADFPSNDVCYNPDLTRLSPVVPLTGLTLSPFRFDDSKYSRSTTDPGSKPVP